MNSLLEEKTASTSQGKTEEITLKNRPIDDRNGAGDSDSPKKKESKHGFKNQNRHRSQRQHNMLLRRI